MRKLSFLLIALVACFTFTRAEIIKRVNIGDLYYNLDTENKTAEVTSENSTKPYWSTSITTADIPSSVPYNEENYSVTSIGDSAFAYCKSLTSVTVPNSVTSIESNAFSGCYGLTGPVYNAHVFGYMPISYTGAYTIPDGIKTIAGGAFFYCRNLTSITIPNTVTSIGEGAFFSCTGLTSVTIPNSVTSIGDCAFVLCTGLTSIEIPNSVTSIGEMAFYGCSGLTEPVYNAHVFAFMPKSRSGSYDIPDGIEMIAGQAFGGCERLTSVTIPNSVTSIGNEAFSECNLKSIEIPNSVTSIGKYAFWSCGIVEPLFNSHIFVHLSPSYYGAYTIPFGIKTIASTAFNVCEFTSVEIPSTVTSIEDEAFYGCNNLTSIICKAVDLPTLGDEVFSGVPKNIPLYVPDGKESAYNGADQWKEFDIKPISAIPTGIKQTSQQPIANSQKLIKNGQLLILRDGKTYTITGQELK